MLKTNNLLNKYFSSQILTNSLNAKLRSDLKMQSSPVPL